MILRKLLQLQLLLLYFSGCIEAYVYSCEEVKYKMIDTGFEMQTRAVCVFTQEGFTNWDQLKKIQVHATSGSYTTSFYDIAKEMDMCANYTVQSPYVWSIPATDGLNLDCAQEFSVIFTSDTGIGRFFLPTRELQQAEWIYQSAMTLVVPQTDMYIHIKSCQGPGPINLYTGSGMYNGKPEGTSFLHSWTCYSLPEWIFSFESVISIYANPTITFEYSSDLGDFDRPIFVPPGDRVAILTSGYSDDLQNLRGGNQEIDEPHRACIMIHSTTFCAVSSVDADDVAPSLKCNQDVMVNMDLTFDSSNNGSIEIQTLGGDTERYHNGTYTQYFNTDYFEIRYVPELILPSEVGDSQDNIFIEISIGTQSSTTKAPTTPPNNDNTSPYCNCAMDRFGLPVGWNYNEIWVDIIVILDTSEAMGQLALDNAGALVESFISDGYDDFLITDTNASYYSRIGVIGMADTATTLYNLNMTKYDAVQGKATIKKGVPEIDVVNAFEAALEMFNDGLKTIPDRVNARQVIYYMTDSDAKSDLSPINKFKASQGVIVVNNFLHDGEFELPGLRDLASPGYYFTDGSYTTGLQAFCKANCFCKPEKSTYGGADPAIKASGGCYYAAAAGVAFNKAKTTCSNEGGILAAIHNEEKGVFLQQLLTSAKSDYFWFGYEKSEDGKWRWADASDDPYTNWDVNEPSDAPVAKCAYGDRTTPSGPWGAGNCAAGFPYICQYPPCSVGYKDC